MFIVSIFALSLNEVVMRISQMQEQLIRQISTISDKDILRMLGEELSYSIESKEDLAGILSEADLKELITLANEPVEGNTMSLHEFNDIMEQWRMK